jgi:hypothetical protein
MMTPLTKPTRGTARVAGYDVVREPDKVRRSMGLTVQVATVDELLTGRENIRMIGGADGDLRAVRAAGLCASHRRLVHRKLEVFPTTNEDTGYPSSGVDGFDVGCVVQQHAKDWPARRADCPTDRRPRARNAG